MSAVLGQGGDALRLSTGPRLFSSTSGLSGSWSAWLNGGIADDLATQLEVGSALMALAEAVAADTPLTRPSSEIVQQAYLRVLDVRLRDVEPSQDTIHQVIRREFSQRGLDWEYAWEVARCESDSFALDVIYGPRTGAAGERGIFQLLHPAGVGTRFLEAGYTDFFEPMQQIPFVAEYVAENGWGQWTCAR